MALKDFQLLTGVASEDKAALMYKVFNINDNSWSTYLVKMKVENAIWQVQSIATYNVVSFEKDKHNFLQ
jgi:hypothetical protein